ncbi:plastocyanin [Arthrobacter globiformis]|uniref:cupredoxin domain-containing protein n=1 Tax=Arthrobacter globiformis TaxID=1665 RepID=UPI0027824303|nr:cupredoxin domain-containing protein [Arthrobacter globiformis]MDQ1058547.1 plastocyanin [Arthrobacter globiformis]
MKSAKAMGALTLVAILSGMAGCSVDSRTPSETAGPSASATAITIRDFSYQTPTAVPSGATVTVTNMDTDAHSVTADEGSAFDVNVTGSGGTATFIAPSKPGNYPFHCFFHPDMHGMLTVK